MNGPIPVAVLTGYLGSGKTTLINKILAEPKGKKIAVIVNDIGEVNIDAELIAKRGVATVEGENLVALTNGCICCTLRMDLIEQIVELARTNQFDYILIEASGVCEPIPIAQSVCMVNDSLEKQNLPALCNLDAVIAVVDAYRLLTEFSGGEDLLDTEEEDIGQLLVMQIEFCDRILLNKTDLLTEEENDKVEKIIRVLQPKAEIIRTTFATVDIEKVLDTGLFDFSETFLSAGWVQTMEKDEKEENEHEHHHEHEEHDHHEHHHDHESEHDHHEHEEHDEHEHGHHHHHHDDDHDHLEEYGIATFVYERRRPFDDDMLEAWVNNFPSEVIRCKGLVWLADEDDTSFLLEQAGKSVSVEAFSQWVASLPKEEQELVFEQDPRVRTHWNEECGDRITKLVFIGINMDENAICASLDKCLV